MAARFDLVRVRALAVHVVVEDWSDPDSVASALRRGSALVREAARLLGELLDLEAWSLRVTLPPPPFDAATAARVLGEAVARQPLDQGVYYSLLHVDASTAKPGDVISVLGLGGNVFASVYTPVASEQASGILYEVASRGPGVAERFAVSLPGPVESPYFPAGSTLSPVTGLSASLLYPRLLTGLRSVYAGFDELDEVAVELEDALLRIAERLGVEYRGIDLSLSPWMDESVAGVVEEYSGLGMGELGVGPFIAWLEEFIEDVCLDVECTGYNQVMLPVAEDNVLKKRVASREVTLYKLVHLAYNCTSGVDMVLLPRSQWSPGLAAGLLREVARAARLKGKPQGVRVVAVDAGPGETVELPRFGPTPVAELG